MTIRFFQLSPALALMRGHSTRTTRRLTVPQPFNKMATKFLPLDLRSSCERLSPMPNNSEINFAGIDVSATTLRGLVVSPAGEITERAEATYAPENLIAEIANLVTGLRQAGPIQSVGLAIPGLVNRETDQALISTGLPFAAQDNIQSEWMKATGLRFELE